LLRDHAEALGMVIAPSDQGGARRRAQRRGVEIRVTQPRVAECLCLGQKATCARGKATSAYPRKQTWLDIK
jgi:hypothetical protein